MTTCTPTERRTEREGVPCDVRAEEGAFTCRLFEIGDAYFLRGRTDGVRGGGPLWTVVENTGGPRVEVPRGLGFLSDRASARVVSGRRVDMRGREPSFLFNLRLTNRGASSIIKLHL